jgi:hypothetical protein
MIPIGTYNGKMVCRCVASCDFNNAWINAGKPTHFPDEMVLNREYMPSKDELPLYKFVRTSYCLNR